MYTILIITKLRRKSFIKTKLDQYSGLIYALKEYKELDYIINIGHMTKNILNIYY